MGKPWENGDLYGKSQFLMGKSRNHMVIFNSYVSLPEGRIWTFAKAWGHHQIIHLLF